MKKEILWTYAAVIFAAGYVLYEFYSSAKDDCYKHAYVASTFCSIVRD